MGPVTNTKHWWLGKEPKAYSGTKYIAELGPEVFQVNELGPPLTLATSPLSLLSPSQGTHSSTYGQEIISLGPKEAVGHLELVLGTWLIHGSQDVLEALVHVASDPVETEGLQSHRHRQHLAVSEPCTEPQVSSSMTLPGPESQVLHRGPPWPTPSTEFCSASCRLGHS